MFAPSERVTKMKADFMQLHREGKTIQEIAELYSLHSRTVYLHLQDIADANHVSRESLLSVPHKPHEMMKNVISIKHRDDVNIEELRNSFADIRGDIDIIISKIDNILK